MEPDHDYIDRIIFCTRQKIGISHNRVFEKNNKDWSLLSGLAQVERSHHIENKLKNVQSCVLST
jgi:hypothetical protein